MVVTLCAYNGFHITVVCCSSQKETFSVVNSENQVICSKSYTCLTLKTMITPAVEDPPSDVVKHLLAVDLTFYTSNIRSISDVKRYGEERLMRHVIFMCVFR